MSTFEKIDKFCKRNYDLAWVYFAIDILWTLWKVVF